MFAFGFCNCVLIGQTSWPLLQELGQTLGHPWVPIPTKHLKQSIMGHEALHAYTAR